MRLVVPVVKFSTKTIDVGRPGAKKQSDGKRRRRLLLPAALILVLAVCGVVWKNLSSPSVGQVAKFPQDTAPTTKLPEYTSLTTPYYTVNYSGRYSQQPTDIPPAGILDQRILSYDISGGSGQSRIQIDIKAAPDGGITQGSDYIYYQKRQSTYAITNALYRGEIVDIAKHKQGSPEETALWLHGSFLMVIKITTPDKTQSIDGELRDLLSSTQWRQ